jgi:hypothetical protein
MSNNILYNITSALEELERMHQLNYELLEQLNVIFGYLNANKVKVPDEEKLAGLLTKAMALLAEVQAGTPKTLQYQKISRRKVTDIGEFNGTDKEVTEPLNRCRR